MELRHLTLFLAAAEELNFTRAAASVFTTQSSLSRAIQDLERELAVQLFDRSTAPLTLTPSGLTLRTEAQGLMEHMQRVVERVTDAAEPTSRTLVVGCVADLPFQLLPDAIGRFRRELPAVTVRLQMMSVSELDRAVADGSVDIGFSWGGTGAGERFGQLEVGLMMPASHRLAGLPRLTPAAVQLESMIVIGGGLPLHERLTASWSREEGQPTIIHGVDRWEDGQRLVSAGLGTMLVPLHPPHEIAHSGVIVRPFSPPLHAELWLRWAPARLDRRIAAFRDAIAATRLPSSLVTSPAMPTRPQSSGSVRSVLAGTGSVTR